jgi:hypothetical protein
VPAQGKECFSTGRASSARDQSRSPPILEDYPLPCMMYMDHQHQHPCMAEHSLLRLLRCDAAAGRLLGAYAPAAS